MMVTIIGDNYQVSDDRKPIVFCSYRRFLSFLAFQPDYFYMYPDTMWKTLDYFEKRREEGRRLIYREWEVVYAFPI